MDWPVGKITHRHDGAIVHGPHGQRKRFRHVLVTASLAVLQSGMITFEPPLPDAKQGAIDRLKMSNAVKVWPPCVITLLRHWTMDEPMAEFSHLLMSN